MSKPLSPCRDCRPRSPGCHDVDACPAWGIYQQNLAAWHAMYRAATIPQAELHDYEKRRREVCRNRIKRRD